MERTWFSFLHLHVVLRNLDKLAWGRHNREPLLGSLLQNRASIHAGVAGGHSQESGFKA